MKKYSTFLTILLVILTISLIILVGYAIYSVYDEYSADKSSEELMNQFENNFALNDNEQQHSEEPEVQEPEVQEPTSEQNTQTPTETHPKTPNTNTSTYGIGTYYKQYKVIGIISIPKLNIQYPIFNVDKTETLRVGTVAIYPIDVETTLNTPGNVVIAGHHYNNSSKMFSKLYTLSTGDSIFITNIYGNKLEYKVYNNYTEESTNFNYATRDTNGYTEISLTTCTNDASTRTIVWARAEKGGN